MLYEEEPKLEYIPVAMLHQMFRVISTRFHTVMQTFVPLIDSVVDRCR